MVKMTSKENENTVTINSGFLLTSTLLFGLLDLILLCIYLIKMIFK